MRLTEAQREVLHTLATVRNATIIYETIERKAFLHTPYHGRWKGVRVKTLFAILGHGYIYIYRRNFHQHPVIDYITNTIEYRITSAGLEALSDGN
jgi:hypothetical protein